MSDLRKIIIAKLQGKSPKVDEALVKATQGDSTALDTIAKNLDVLMDDEPEFAAEVKVIAHEINIGKIHDNSTMNQDDYDNAKGWQTKVEGEQLILERFISNNLKHKFKSEKLTCIV
jgi:hypothetical protein